jgi:hypothetical protein
VKAKVAEPRIVKQKKEHRCDRIKTGILAVQAMTASIPALAAAYGPKIAH